MSELNSHESYIVSAGEATAEDWQLGIRLIGRLGIAIEPANADAEPPVSETSQPAPPFGPPYKLDDIDSADQFLGVEHFYEFWPEYRRMLVEGGGRVPSRWNAVRESWRALFEQHPRNRIGPSRLIVKTRQEAGFGLVQLTVKQAGAYTASDEATRGRFDETVRVGSFVLSMLSPPVADFRRRMRHFPIDARRYSVSFAESLSAGLLNL